ATRFSTSSAEAPGISTRTSAKGTTICGSSSRGVASSATAPAASEAMRKSTDSLEVMKISTTRAVQPRAGRPVSFIAAVRSSLDHHHVPGGQAGEDLDALADRLAGAHAAQARRAVDQHRHGLQLTGATHGG